MYVSFALHKFPFCTAEGGVFWRTTKWDIMAYSSTLILLRRMFVGWTLGANDAANAMGTAVGAKVRTIREAVIIVGVFSLAGAAPFWPSGH